MWPVGVRAMPFSTRPMLEVVGVRPVARRRWEAGMSWPEERWRVRESPERPEMEVGVALVMKLTPSRVRIEVSEEMMSSSSAFRMVVFRSMTVTLDPRRAKTCANSSPT